MSARIGLVGCGAWGQHIARDLLTLGCEVTVVARSPASIARAQAAGVHAIAHDVAGLPALVGAVVATPTTSHAVVIEALLDRGVPVFTEKPLCSDPENARALLARAAGRVFVMDKWRYHPGVAALAAVAREQRLGQVVGLRCLRMGWRERLNDVDALFHLMPHDLAICLEILGFLPEPRAAAPELLEGEAVGCVATFGSTPWAVIEVSERRRRHFREVRLYCEKGSATLTDAYSDAVLVSRHGRDGRPPPVERVPFSAELPLLAELRAFVSFVRGGPPPKSGLADAVAIVERIAAVRALAGLPPMREPRLRGAQ